MGWFAGGDPAAARAALGARPHPRAHGPARLRGHRVRGRTRRRRRRCPTSPAATPAASRCTSATRCSRGPARQARRRPHGRAAAGLGRRSQRPGPRRPKISAGSPGRNVPCRCDASPISRFRRSSARPSASWLLLPGGERRIEVTGVGRDLRGQLPAVGRGLGRARRGVRPHRERRVADEADPAVAHAGHVDVEHRLQERLRHARDDLGHHRREPLRRLGPHRRDETVVDLAGRHRHRPGPAVAPGHQRVERGPGRDVAVPDEVHQPFAQARRARGWGRRGCGCRAAPGR